MVMPTARDRRRGQTEPILLIPELCVLTGVNEQMRTDFNFKRTLENFSKVDPSSRQKRLSDFINRFSRHDQVRGELENWQINFKEQLYEVEARCLPPETLAFGGGRLKKLDERADWGNDIKGLQVFSNVPLNKWLILYPGNKRQAANVFLNTFAQIIDGMGIRANGPIEIQMPTDHADMVVNTLKQNITPDTQLVVVLVSNKRKDRYDAIKRVCCLEKPVSSQVCTTQLLENDRKAKSCITKIALQINCKLGGELWITNIPVRTVFIFSLYFLFYLLY